MNKICLSERVNVFWCMKVSYIDLINYIVAFLDDKVVPLEEKDYDENQNQQCTIMNQHSRGLLL